MIDKLGTKWIEINLDVLGRNIKAIKEHVSPVGIMAVIKADAYGHGAVEVARHLEKCGIRIFAVSCLEEAIELRQHFISKGILIFGAIPEAQICDIINYDLMPTITTADFAASLDKQAGEMGKIVRAHIYIDTGMGRVGPLYSEAAPFIKKMARFKNIKVTGIYTHFATSELADAFAQEQRKRFDAILKNLTQEGIVISAAHMANSGAVVNLANSRYSLVRPGLLIYGIYPCEKKRGYPAVQPVFSFKARVVFKKTIQEGFSVGYGRRFTADAETDIVTLPVGYADGFSRKFTNAGKVIIRGKKYPVVGSVCMDMIMVNAGAHSPIEVGDEAVIIGKQGKEEISVYDIARELDTIPYEVICSIGRRVTRVYLNKGTIHAVQRMVSEF
ncbi:MAG: alanine racemase [Candidatus Raymondbacteria bacterium RifOxyA12_full_50_37]|uniref:Alanine racemase n=1 Tax=Candidatus Raymondbacteria bacterium RIFOXYD12_FULL_49_13 TaxID=1817890 RepID=A0A1F7FAS5_UNCRA|nr:MAG: alanine racemase [Candidatus Raymondbacteria bacterium RifOxyA12_full_50_37]OGJ92194.1 MAG: alanine racemase [Candidatus Raymondbacteria bacterium RifOxyB12_full_50_8]OGJ92638.1 MAG: alanine racemase [Candidatus Raymondbacteria bacterium RIFOXYA2_FULL_49_16]OGJ97992.1 MAG: alanine racemase [Candidatus Raymondbacteria bacterium RIFOXYC2_FULL_50_21]OGJ99856.1 MAG: alanine racemase [Candidatus Raymondbacteria bacterium RifOxyC12_full_50_8]OGK03770.1 MAG: alanine racemase [Candidatus Raymo